MSATSPEAAAKKWGITVRDAMLIVGRLPASRAAVLAVLRRTISTMEGRR